jgi:hypothetical protein
MLLPILLSLLAMDHSPERVQPSAGLTLLPHMCTCSVFVNRWPSAPLSMTHTVEQQQTRLGVRRIASLAEQQV